MMKNSIDKQDLFGITNLTILVSYTVFSVLTAAEALLLGWELWAVLLIGIAVCACWVLHIQSRFPAGLRLWICSLLMMVTFFFYGIHDSTLDITALMCTAILLYTTTGNKGLISLCQITYILTLGYGVFMKLLHGEGLDVWDICRIILHTGMMFAAGLFARRIIDKWMKVFVNSRNEIELLTDATDRLNDFLANVSHELRTPINAVIGLSSICIEKEQVPALRRDMQAVNEAGQRVAEQISDILDYSETDRNRLVRCDEEYMLSSVLNDLVNEIRPHCPKNLELIIDVDPAIPAVMYTDAGKLKKILRHLIMNGLKYTKEG
ncbi:MAG: HAMP domain-containing histidine kinase, partial [Oscillospiraceae bacterium]|nr:HAMP domain-containing histidine kinase [Oscillospiraceae bacterium]